LDQVRRGWAHSFPRSCRPHRGAVRMSLAAQRLERHPLVRPVSRSGHGGRQPRYIP
jgi:hypothetical protein